MAAPQPDSMRGPSVKTPLLLLLLLLLSALTRTVFCQDVEDPSDYSATENTENPDYTENPDDTGNPDYTENPHDTESQGETENPEEPVDGAIFSVDGSEGGDDLSAIPPEDENDAPVSDATPSEEPDTGDGDPDKPFESGSGTEFPGGIDPWSTSDPETQDLNPIIILIPVALVVLIISLIVLGIFISRRLKKQTRKQEFQKDPYLDSPSEEKVPMPMFEEDVPSVLELEMEELDQWMKKDSENAGESTQT